MKSLFIHSLHDTIRFMIPLKETNLTQEPITRSLQRPYCVCETAFSQVSLVLDKPFPRISFGWPITSDCVMNRLPNNVILRQLSQFVHAGNKQGDTCKESSSDCSAQVFQVLISIFTRKVVAEVIGRKLFSRERLI